MASLYSLTSYFTTSYSHEMLFSIIIVNYNTRQLTSDCIDSIYRHYRKKDFEIIIIDNKSLDDSISYIKKNYPEINLIANKENYGFGKANNIGAKQARGEYLLFLNSDTKFKSNVFDSISKHLSPHKILGIKLLNQNDSTQPSAGYFPTISRIRNQILFIDDLPFFSSLKKYQQSNLDFYQKNQNVDWVTGAFLLIHKSLFSQIQGFDENIFMYGEEIDLCYRAKEKSAKINFLTSPEIYHLKGASSKNGFQSAVLGEYQGLITFYKKHFPDKIQSLQFYLKLGALLRIVLFAIIDSSKSKIYLKAYQSL